MTHFAPAARPGGRGHLPALLAAVTLLLLGSNVQAGVAQQSMRVSAKVVEGCSQLGTTRPTSSASSRLPQDPLQIRCSNTLDYSVSSYTEDNTTKRSQTTTRVLVVEF